MLGMIQLCRACVSHEGWIVLKLFLLMFLNVDMDESDYPWQTPALRQNSYDGVKDRNHTP